ncbi:MAG: mechanosensitive ion channel [Bacteroidetes bacterium]|nr:mechanosensitive ion channel [Bacteroidota bacterium]
MSRKYILFIFSVLLFLSFPLLSEAQKRKEPAKVQKDTITVIDSLPIKYPVNVDSLKGGFLAHLEEFTEILNRSNGILKRGYDTSIIADELPNNERLVSFIKNNITNSQYYNFRNLTSSKVVLKQLKKQLRVWEETLLAYNSQIAQLTININKVAKEASIVRMTEDSVLLEMYLKKINTISEKWKKADSSSKVAFRKMGFLENRVVGLSFEISDLLDEVDFQISNYKKKSFSKEEPYLFLADSKIYPKILTEVISDSFLRAYYLVPFYFKVTSEVIFYNLIWIIALFFWLFWAYRKLEKNNDEKALSKLKYLSKGVWLVVLFIGFLFSPLLYDTPPISYLQILITCLSLLYTILVWDTWTIEFKRSWICFLAIFILASIDSILIESALMERWILLVINLSSIVLAIYMQREMYAKNNSYSIYYRWLISLFLILNSFAFVMNLFGRITLAKIFTGSSVVAIIYALSLDLLEAIIFEVLLLNIEAFKESKFASLLNFQELKAKFRSTIYIVLSAFWAIIFFYTLNLYDFIINGSRSFFSTEIELGDLKFTFGHIVLFVIIIYISSVISKLLTYFFGSTGQFATNKKNKNGSWVLLLRLSVFTIGIFVAFAASGIPIDKLTIIIGALGVGIGFGLQNIINNLVSGIVLAFEKPMQIGDVIEIENHIGTVKEIGIRSSKITTYDGAEIVVPNGEFISKQITNWTLTNTYRRIELIIGVAYESDLNNVKELLDHIVENHPGIIKFPKPIVLLHEFSDSSVNFRVLFWTGDFDSWTSLKSSVLLDIFKAFKENGITIPFPQHDIHVKTTTLKDLEKGSENKE